MVQIFKTLSAVEISWKWVDRQKVLGSKLELFAYLEPTFKSIMPVERGVKSFKSEIKCSQFSCSVIYGQDLSLFGATKSKEAFPTLLKNFFENFSKWELFGSSDNCGTFDVKHSFAYSTKFRNVLMFVLPRNFSILNFRYTPDLRSLVSVEKYPLYKRGSCIHIQHSVEFCFNIGHFCAYLK